MGQGIISADGHLDPEYLPRDAFTSVAAARAKSLMPRVEETPQGPFWVAGDTHLGTWGSRRIREQLASSRRGAAMRAAGFDPEQLRPADPALRVQDQLRDGVDAEVLYGALRRWKYLAGMDPASAAVIVAAYNDYVAAFCGTHPGRLFAIGAVPAGDPQAMAAELPHIVQLGLVGAEVPTGEPAPPLWDSHWEPLWHAAVEHDLPLHVHVQAASHTQPAPSAPLIEYAVFICGVPLQLQPTLNGLLLSGVLERHPKLKIVFAESGTGWIPYLLDRIDYEWENAYAEWQTLCKTAPSELFRRQVYATFQEDAVGPQLARHFPNNFLWGSDYPHADCIWPDSQEIIRRTMGNLDEALRRRIIHDNAAALYRIDLAAASEVA
jgi:predicted TIM-barrel fold metal-dependent hydrolase